MNLVVLNAGSGSQQCSLFKLEGETWPAEPRDADWEARIDATAPGQPADQLRVEISRHGRAEPTQAFISAANSPTERVAHLLQRLWDGSDAPLADAADLDGVGHRVVHGGARFHEATRIDDAVETDIEGLCAFAPLHNPVNLAGIRVARQVLPDRVPHVAVFDTAFHQTIADAAATYPGPYAWRERGVRRYGFHGTSFRWASERAATLLRRSGDPELRLILCHLGGGCSLCATVGGRSSDTTMGFTPLDGIAMCTRSGSVDPGILLHLLRNGTRVDEVETMLNRESGLAGLSGLPGDTRVILPQVAAGNARAALAWDVFIHRLRQGIGAMLASLGARPDAIVFTDVIGETVPQARSAACAAFGFLDLQIDPEKNVARPVDADVAMPHSATRVLVIQGREGWQIARECHATLVHASTIA